MNNVTTPVDCKANLECELARIDREIRAKRHDVSCLEEEISDLEIERQELLEQLELNDHNQKPEHTTLFCAACGKPIAKGNYCHECVDHGLAPCEACEGRCFLMSRRSDRD